eukprot:2627228-Prymnesium_polylepis.1
MFDDGRDGGAYLEFSGTHTGGCGSRIDGGAMCVCVTRLTWGRCRVSRHPLHNMRARAASSPTRPW